MAYLYETHLHTSQTSRCAESTGAEHARYYKEIGFTGVMVTDHFFNGNTTVPRELPWTERIDRFCAGYEDALCEGQKIGLDVFIGWEHNFDGDDYLVYGLDKAWLKAHPEMENWTHREQIEHIRAAGGCVVQAHPFRTRAYIRNVTLGLDYCDAIEAANAGNDAFSDAFALAYAKKHDLMITAGSDNHHSYPGLDAQRQVFGVALETRLTSIGDYVRLIRERQPVGLYVPKDRFDVKDCPQIESFYWDEDKGLLPTGRPQLCDWA